jgi:hypothetical protein
MDWGPLLAVGTILTIALGVGLSCGAVALTVAVLWKECWARFWVRRLQWFGHTKLSTTVAVAISLALWVGIVAAFTLPSYWRVSLVVLLATPAAFFAVGWYFGGPKMANHRARFACSFFEPAFALVAPSLGSKLIDAMLRTLTVPL